MRRHRFPDRSRRAFAALDLFVALVVLAILLSLALPSLAGRERRAAADAAARRLRGDLARARAAAVLGGATVTVALDTTAGGWTASTAGGDTLFTTRLRSDLALRTTAHRQAIPFTARGTSNLYSTTWVLVPADPDAPWRGTRVSPAGTVELR